ncbi:MAG: HAD family hydrolase [Bacteroidetes bacterium]|nr:HAD family hydrolase [Bacteroidota bacterium]
MNLVNYHIDKSWTLFLDRDGVINRRIKDDYVKSIAEFVFLEKVPESLEKLTKLFGRIFIVTNQQGVGKGLINLSDLQIIHTFMLNEIEKAGGKIDQVFFCPELNETNHPDRKPQIGMALKAKGEFPEIDFSKSIMVGDSISDIEFGKNAGMRTVFVSAKHKKNDEIGVDAICVSLSNFTDLIINKHSSIINNHSS